ncbi:MAG: secretin and TonB N-terminal domain-containing protein [Planctomycetes bacterium]|nr:secretin and TonB N-terminal domain-containing protein [Planctomycetota bacterium]
MLRTTSDRGTGRGGWLVWTCLAWGLVVGSAGLTGCGSAPASRDTASNTMDSDGTDPGAAAAVPTTSGQAPSSSDPHVEDLVTDITAEAQRRRQEARFKAREADRHFADSEYELAERLYGEAIDLDPTQDEWKRKRTLALMFLGRRDGEIRSMMEDFSYESRVIEGQRLAETQRLLDAGDQYLADDNVERALQEYSRARQNLLWFDYRGVDTAALERRAEESFERARQMKIELTEKRSEQQNQSAGERAEAREQAARRAREQRVRTLLDNARDSMRLRDYDTVVRVGEAVLGLDPANPIAEKYIDEARERKAARDYVDYLESNAQQTRNAWDDLEEASVPYDRPFRFTNDPDEWRTKVQPRALEATRIDFEEDYEVTKIRTVLNESSPSLQFSDESLQSVVNFLMDVASLNISIDPEIDAEETKVTVKLEGVKLAEALDLILTNTGLAYTFRENTLYITQKGAAHGDTIFHIYNVSDILNRIKDFPGPTIRVKSNDEGDDGASPFGFAEDEETDAEPLTAEDLATKIMESTGGEEFWEENGSSVTGHKGQLLVTGTRDLHVQTQEFLKSLRKDSDIFVIVETRFIDMVDDFLEDIGVDSRNLGQPPGTGFGTAYGLLNSATTGGLDPGFMNRGNPTNPSLIQGQDRLAGRLQNIIDGFVGVAQGTRLQPQPGQGLSLQVTWLDPFQINAILRATSEERQARIVTAPRVTASNGQRVHVSVITQRSYVQDYELVSGGTGLVVQEVADPVVATFQEGVILDVRPVISHDRKYITLDVRPTLASLVNGVISTVTVSLGSLLQAATLVDIDLPEISLQQAFTSVTVPDGGTVLLGGFRSMNEREYESFVPLIGRIPIIKNAFRRKAYISEKRSLYILLTARIIDLRAEERELYN